MRSAFRSLVLKFETVYQRISNHHTISYDVSFRSRVKRSTVPFQRGPPSIFISLSVYTYATTRRCISRYDAAPPAFEKCVGYLSASTAGAHTRLCKHTCTLPSSANTLASPKLCQHTRISQALAPSKALLQLSQPTPAYLAVSSLDPIYPNYLNSILGATSCCHE